MLSFLNVSRPHALLAEIIFPSEPREETNSNIGAPKLPQMVGALLG